MSEPAQFLNGLAQALSTMMLYGEGHPARERVLETAYRGLRDLQSAEPRPIFTFLGEEVICGNRPVRELRGWDWTPRFVAAGLQRLEFGENVVRQDFDAFLEEVLARLTAQPAETASTREMRATSIRFGAVGVRDASRDESAEAPAIERAAVSLAAEAEAVRWLHDQVGASRPLPIAELISVVRSLTIAMHAEEQVVLPLLKTQGFEEYLITHALNVSVLSMALAEAMSLGQADVRAIGEAALLHDIGKVAIPRELLTKPGKLSEEERAEFQRHPVEGARMILASTPRASLTATVAYEHHIMLDGGGYPTRHFPSDCYFASKLVHVCDVYDALRSERPYRDAWTAEQALAYIDQCAGTELDPQLARTFTTMMRRWEERVVKFAGEP
ncbi:MAG: HD domain-containing protein [Gemmatimonadetes bacterium]|nr:HD domain-containing protein [Gemmatimonadota bacterium]